MLIVVKRKSLYLECKTGISGDMTVAALLDLGADRKKLEKTLKSLQVEGYDVEVSHPTRGGLAGCDFCVNIHSHKHEHKNGHGEHHHGHDSHGHPEHRGLSDIERLIDGADLTPNAKGIARKIFEIIALAEAKAHGIDIEKVHFHEIGAIDSIVDIVGAAFCLDDLGIGEVIVPFLVEGGGTITCQHGVLPVPVPAVVNIASAYHIPLRIADVDTELVTPTGAAIVAAVGAGRALPQTFSIEKIGIGFGKKDLGRPNFLRAMLIKSDAEASAQENHVLLESNIDDSTGQQLGVTMEKLLLAGAFDVHYIPCFMKKNRPGYLLRVLCMEPSVPELEDIVFRNTTTIGIRKTTMAGTALRQEVIFVDLPYGQVQVKKCFWRNDVFYYPEFESVKKLADDSRKSFAEVFAAAKVQAQEGGTRSAPAGSSLAPTPF
jgi:uncharacterized protein (TIGR00299 family) protein